MVSPLPPPVEAILSRALLRSDSFRTAMLGQRKAKNTIDVYIERMMILHVYALLVADCGKLIVATVGFKRYPQIMSGKNSRSTFCYYGLDRPTTSKCLNPHNVKRMPQGNM